MTNILRSAFLLADDASTRHFISCSVVPYRDKVLMSHLRYQSSEGIDAWDTLNILYLYFRRAVADALPLMFSMKIRAGLMPSSEISILKKMVMIIMAIFGDAPKHSFWSLKESTYANNHLMPEPFYEERAMIAWMSSEMSENDFNSRLRDERWFQWDYLRRNIYWGEWEDETSSIW